MTMHATSYESTRWTQKEVLVFIQKILHDKKVVILPSVNWSGLDLRGINLKNANLKFANLSNSNLQYADLENANLRYADLSNCDFSNAKLVSTDMSEATCDGARFDGSSGLGDRFRAKWKIPEDEKKPRTSFMKEGVDSKESVTVVSTVVKEVESPPQEKKKSKKKKTDSD